LKCTNNVNLDKNYTGIWIWREEWAYVNIGFQFWSSDKDLIYGFTAKRDPVKEQLPIELKSSFNVLGDKSLRQNGWWPLCYKMEEPFSNWQKYAAWKAMAGGSMLQIMKEKIEYLLESSQGIEL